MLRESDHVSVADIGDVEQTTLTHTYTNSSRVERRPRSVRAVVTASRGGGGYTFEGSSDVESGVEEHETESASTAGQAVAAE